MIVDFLSIIGEAVILGAIGGAIAAGVMALIARFFQH